MHAGLEPGVRNPGVAIFSILVVLAVGPGAASALAAVPPEELWTRCDAADAAIQCDIPRGIAADPGNGHIFVADQINRRIDEFNAVGQFIRAWGTEGAGAGQFSGVHGVAVDSAGDVYANDRNNHRVQKFDSEGHFLLMFGGEVNKTKSEEIGSTEAERNLCTAASGDECMAGVEGIGQGQFGAWAVGDFIAIDPSDKVYVGDVGRIQRFDAGGHYVEDVPEDPAGELKESIVQSLATDSAGNLYATYENKPDVRKITPAGAELLTPRFKLPKTGSEGNTEAIPTAVAVDAAGDVFAVGPNCSLCSGTPVLADPIHEFDAMGKEVTHWGKEEFSASTGLAANLCAGSEAPGNLYVSNSVNGTPPPHANEGFVRAYGGEPVGCFKARTLPASGVKETAAVLNGTVNPVSLTVSECRFEYGTDETYGHQAVCAESPAAIGNGSEPVPVHADLGEPEKLQKGTVYHFRLLAKVGTETETGADEEFKTLGPPVITADRTAGATDTQLDLAALVNPEGFAATYHFEYGATTEYGQNTPETPIGSDRDDHAAANTLEGLSPGQTYHWRIVATNSSGTTAGKDHAATTYRTFVPQANCPNQAFRTGPAASLPDCRAYEMVSPLDKNGGDIVGPGEEGYVQASADGGKLTYSAVPVFADEPSGYVVNQYLAARGASGWSNHGIHPPVTGKTIGGATGLNRGFMAFTSDLCSAWVLDEQTPPVTAAGQVGYENLYRRQNCDPGVGELEALTPSPPALPEGIDPEYLGQSSPNTAIGGISEDGRRVFFLAKVALPQVPDASPGTKAQIYEHFEGALSVVSVLPNGAPGDPAPGDGKGFANPTRNAMGSGWDGNLKSAVAADGSRVYWTADVDINGRGRVYVRRNPEQGIVSGECTGAGTPCTIPVSGGGVVRFLGATPDGSRALYGEDDGKGGGESLYEFDLKEAEEGDIEPQRLIVADTKGFVAASEDLTRVYFVSENAIAGSGQNSEEDEAAKGEPNLYLVVGGATRFVATLAAGDVGTRPSGALLNAYNLIGTETRLRASRLSDGGAQLAFESQAQLTDFDNNAADSGEPAVEVYRYDAGSGKLACVSCNPSGARPQTREMYPTYSHNKERPTKVTAAAWIPTWQEPLYPSNVLSRDGNRLFFNSNDALLSRDINGAPDVYEWEAPGVGGCTVESPSYFVANGGCVYLISSGESSFESEFWDAGPDGQDVFFTTDSSLLPQDPGLIDLYDARIGGGFAKSIPSAACEGEACQSPPPPPIEATPASASYRGPGNARSPQRCRKRAKRPAKSTTGRAARRARKPSHNAKRCKHANRRAER